MECAGYIKLKPWKVFVMIEGKQEKRKVKVSKAFSQLKEKKKVLADEWFDNVVAIAHNKGVIKCHQYFGPINSEQFSDMFKTFANPKGKVFPQNGDPYQNSKSACETMDSAGFRLFKIPPRSPDLNPIQNTFHLIGKQLKKDAITKTLEHETYEKFSRKAKKGVMTFPLDIINRL